MQDHPGATGRRFEALLGFFFWIVAVTISLCHCAKVLLRKFA